jgi:HEPN domain-containing protein
VSLHLYRELVGRAKHLHRVTEFDAREGRYDIALFHLEQAAQLALKAHLYRTVGDFPKTHSLREVLELAGG